MEAMRRAARRGTGGVVILAVVALGACTYRSGEVSKPSTTTTTVAPPVESTEAPPTDATEETAAPEVAPNGEYTVQPGDTPAEIAARFGVSTEALLQANNITDTGSLQVGQVLKIPARD